MIILVVQEHEKDSMLSSSLPHRCACCAKCFTQLCIRLSACGLSFIFPLELCLQLCIHKLPKLNALCFLAVQVLNFGVERKRASSEHTLSPRSVMGCMSSRHRGQLSVAVEAVANSSRSDLVFTKALLSCAPWSSRDCSDNSTGSHIFDYTWQVSSQRRFCRLHSSTSLSAHPGTRHHSSRTHATRPVASQPPQPKSFNSLDNLRAITQDALLTDSSAPKPEISCNSCSATAAKS